MQREDFYNIVDTELTKIIEKNKNDAYIIKNSKAINNQKAYALLIWFLEFYGKIADYPSYITDGDQDSTCDIVFDSLDNQGHKVFYIVQSKWNTLGNCNKKIDKNNILQALNDFDTILHGKKERVNEKLRPKINELLEHIKTNGDVKIVYLALCDKSSGADDNIKSFLDTNKRTKFEFYDIDRIKFDYIERKYKKIEPINPLENYYNPEDSKIILEVERINKDSGNFIRVDKPFKAYVFLIKPKTIYELFKKYGFALFFKNVRNPLLTSDFNKEIEKTVIDNPAFFWYYNNGITAISYSIPEIRDEATLIELMGLQIINGAQTVYSVYEAYKEATPTKRTIIDKTAIITLRLLETSGVDNDLKITRFTNSQNPVNDRDFMANDDYQIKLQNLFFDTNFWYEKRRGEFREVPAGVERVQNTLIANCFLAYQLQDPVNVIRNYVQMKNSGKNLLFISHKDNNNGLYETIFNSDSNFEDFITAFYLFDTLIKNTPYKVADTYTSNLFHSLSLFKIVFTKYCKSKYNEEVNVGLQIRKHYIGKDTLIIHKTVKFINQYLAEEYKLNGKDTSFEKFISFLTSTSHFGNVKEQLKYLKITQNMIDDIEVEEKEVVFEVRKNETETGY